MPRTAVLGYSKTQIWLHWLIAALIIFQLTINEGMGAAWRAFRRGTELSAGDAFMADIHIWFGIAILALACWRLAVRLARGAPEAATSQSAALRLASSVVHAAIYFLIFAMPITGLLGWYLGQSWLITLHKIGQNALIALVIAHVAGALFHGFVLKDGVLQRMLRLQG